MPEEDDRWCKHLYVPRMHLFKGTGFITAVITTQDMTAEA
jgi:hypothetical protein